MTQTNTEIEWPREIWMAERDEHDQGVVRAVLSEHATVARWEGDSERDREFHHYIDADIYVSAQRYHDTKLAAITAERDTLAKQAEDCARTCAEQADRIKALQDPLSDAVKWADRFLWAAEWVDPAREALKAEPAPGQIERVSLADLEGYGTNNAPRQSVQEAAKVLLEWTGDYIPTVPKLAAIKAHLAHDNKTQPVAISAAWIAALQAIAQEAQD
ncbi:hypothetical protein [Tritonibacter mobilis]|uniref:hypothetical protein n=1 Tax=Tritonibacter mobilis TaxID=379347 RepID=UPI00080696AF|nr:hypothetical protein [Tritonibacter mobilis]